MASRAFSRRILAQSLRARAAAPRPAPAAGRRFASSDVAHGAKQSSDMPWIIGSALVFGPLGVYLLTSSGKQKGHHAADVHHAKAGKAHSPSEPLIQEGTLSTSGETSAPAEESPKDEFVQEGPESQSQSASESDDGKVHGAPAMTDSEGNTASAEEIDASMKQAFKANMPEDAMRAEAEDSKYAEGAPGQTAEAEGKPDQEEHPGRPHTGTLQSDDDSGPTNMGDARAKATSKEAPKQASQD
ncbi:hypothetical protein BV20DRAFT_1118832 [Pilatotrama ljubarskyi]|nr:hypothetical protein BV20DRAFT_1118832 [Pilatotrama ljubarskyi]